MSAYHVPSTECLMSRLFSPVDEEIEAAGSGQAHLIAASKIPTVLLFHFIQTDSDFHFLKI